MAHKAPGKHHREGISLMKLFKMLGIIYESANSRFTPTSKCHNII